MRTIAIFSTIRAEFGLFLPFLKELNKVRKSLKYSVFIGGSHLTSESGNTKREILNNKIKIIDEFDFLLNKDNAFSLTKSMGIAVYELARIFESYDFDYVCCIGDRYELLGLMICSVIYKKPIIHIGGGEKTEGVIDEQVRHAISKIAHIHFTSCKEYSKNLVKMGENRNRVYNVGDLAVDNMSKLKKIKKKILFSSLNLDVNEQVILLTYHPVTLELIIDALEQMQNIFAALKKYPFQVVITAPNVEVDRDKIENSIQEEIRTNANLHYTKSLGMTHYLNLIQHCEFVIGNSSSGIVEVPYFRIPTINIGDRQKGRMRHRSVIDVGYEMSEIIDGINLAMSKKFRAGLKRMKYKFGNGNAAKKMVDIIKQLDEKTILKKSLHY